MVMAGGIFQTAARFHQSCRYDVTKSRLAYRDEFYDPFTNRLVISLFYDTREDALIKAHESGRRPRYFTG